MNDRARVGIIKERSSFFAGASVCTAGTATHARLRRSTDIFEGLSTSTAGSVLSGYAEGPGGATRAATLLSGLRVGVSCTEARLWLNGLWFLNANPLSAGSVFHGHIVGAILWVIVADTVGPNLIRVRGRVGEWIGNAA